MNQLNFRSRLDDVSLDAALRSSKIFRRDGWAASTGLVVDLSALESADFAALARLLSLVEGAVRHEIPVEVVFPDPRLRAEEAAFLDRLAREEPSADRILSLTRSRPNRRRRLLANLYQAGFTEAILHLASSSHLVNISPLVQTGQLLHSSSEFSEAPAGLIPLVLPYRWFEGTHNLPEMHDEWRRLGAEVMSQARHHLPQQASAGIVDALFGEFLENVEEHASYLDEASIEPRALAGANVLPRGLRHWQYRRQSRVPEGTQEYADFLADSRVPIVRLIVSDSGSGIAKTITHDFRARHGVDGSPIDRVFYALSPLATRGGTPRQKRGTRGLARAIRYVRENQGMLTVRTADCLAGFSFADRKEAEIRQTRLQYTPGTTVEVILPALQRRVASRTPTSRNIADKGDTAYFAVPLNPENLEQAEGEIEGCVSANQSRLSVVVFIARSWQLSPKQTESVAIKLLTLALAYEGSCLVCLVVPQARRPEVVAGFQSVDDARDRETKERLQQVRIPPETGVVLVVPSDGDFRFHGGSTEARGLLYSLAERDGSQGDSPMGAATDLIRYGLPGRHWIQTENGRISLTTDANRVSEFLRSQAVGLVRAAVSST